MRVRIILAFFVLAATSLLAQTFRGTVLGTVTDASGAVVSGAKVAVRNVNTGQERTTETSGDGSYSVPELPIGTYTVTITQSGFQTSVTSGVVVDVASERRVDAALKAGQVSQTVEVSGEELSQVETTSAQLGGTLTTRDYCQRSGQWPGLYQADLSEPGSGWFARSDFGFSGVVRDVFDEWITGTVEQFPARRHGYE